MKCCICSSNKIKILYKLKGYHVAKCKSCELIFSWPPKKQDYEKNYFTEEHKKYFIGCGAGYDENDEKVTNFQNGLGLIEKYEKKTNKNILDVGCATGVFLNIAKKRGWEVYGIDISKYAVDYAKKNFKIRARAGELNKTSYKNEFFDVITLWDSIEHINNPIKVIKVVKKILKKQGILFISTINESSLMNKAADIIYKFSFGVIKKPIELLHPRQHITHFSDRTLKNMLEKEGFEIIEIKKLEVPIKNLEGRWLKKQIISFFYILQKISNKHYMIWVVAKKK